MEQESCVQRATCQARWLLRGSEYPGRSLAPLPPALLPGSPPATDNENGGTGAWWFSARARAEETVHLRGFGRVTGPGMQNCPERGGLEPGGLGCAWSRERLWVSGSSMWVADGKGSCRPHCGLARSRQWPAAGRMLGLKRSL